MSGSSLRWAAYAAAACFVAGAIVVATTDSRLGLWLCVAAGVAYVAVRIAMIVRGRRP
jgi:drug/metabolite transporter (DMT)-like permease